MAVLTNKQSLFCQEFIMDFNGLQAAIRAGYSKKTAGSIASENLKKPEIIKEIQRAIDKRSKALKIDSEYVLKRLVEIDQLDVIDILNDEGALLPIKEWPKSWRISLSGFEITELASSDSESQLALLKKIKWPDKTRNLELIGRHVNVRAWDSKIASAADSSIEEINFDINSSEDIRHGMQEVMNKAMNKHISFQEASRIIGMLDRYRNAYENDVLEKQLREFEEDTKERDAM